MTQLVKIQNISFKYTIVLSALPEKLSQHDPVRFFFLRLLMSLGASIGCDRTISGFGFCTDSPLASKLSCSSNSK